MSQHSTSGWTSRVISIDQDARTFIIHDGKGRLVAKLAHKADPVELEANRAVIEAAPDLLEALRLALNYLDHPDVQALPFVFSAAAAAKRVREAIAKAEGKLVTR